MANVNIKFNGKEFLLSCEDGQEEHLEELAFCTASIERARIELDNVLFNFLKNLSFVDLGESIYYYRYIYEFN